MPAEYINIPQCEMDDFLTKQGFSLLNLGPQTQELVYGKRVHHPKSNDMPLTLRIFTGIVPSGQSREVGRDAIRPVIFWKNPKGDIRLVHNGKRVHRVLGWRKNLQQRIDHCFDDMLMFVCSQCGGPMKYRKGKNGTFVGCVDFPNCKHTFTEQYGETKR